MLIDTHCHVINMEYDNIDEVIKRFGNNIMIISGYDAISNRDVVSIATHYKNVYGMLGYHPDEINSFNDDELKYIEANLSNPKIVGIGEIGLDYYHNSSNKENQIEMFRKLLSLASKLKKPVTIHSREAAYDTMNVLNDYNLKVTMHCFSYSKEVAQECVRRGYMLGIGGVLTFKNSRKLVEVVESIPLENIVLETDSPYLTPEPFRGHKNEPFYIKYVVQTLAQIKNSTEENIILITYKNAISQFDLNS